MTQSGDLSFDPLENPWPYRLFLLISVVGFAAPAWLGPFGAILTDGLNNPALARWTSSWILVDRWIVQPQVRLLEFVTPPLAERWPVADGLMNAHRIMFSALYAVLGWVSVRLACAQFQVWWLRIWWLIIYWIGCIAFLEGVTLVMAHFGVLPGG